MVLLLQYLSWTTEIANRLQCLSQDSNKWLTLPISRWNTVHWKDVSYCVANSCFIPFSMELIYLFYECRRKKLKWWLYYLILRSVRLLFFCYDEINFILSTLKRSFFFQFIYQRKVERGWRWVRFSKNLTNCIWQVIKKKLPVDFYGNPKLHQFVIQLSTWFWRCLSQRKRTESPVKFSGVFPCLKDVIKFLARSWSKQRNFFTWQAHKRKLFWVNAI